MNIGIENGSRRLLMALMLVLMAVSNGFAQEPLTLKDALRYAMNNSEALQKARLEIEGGRLKVAEVRSTALPQIEGISTLTNNLLVQQFILPAEFMGGEPGQFKAVEAGQTWN